jgi:starch synthase
MAESTTPSDALRVLLLSAEVTPFAKTGGLGDVTAALARYLNEAGHDARLFMPGYRDFDFAGTEPVIVDFATDVPVHIGSHTYAFTLYTTPIPDTDVWIYIIHCPELFDRPGFYTDDPDEHLRFLVFCRACLESCQRMGWSPHVLHGNDWHTGLAPLYLDTQYRWDGLFAETKSLITIHNIGYQGMFPAERLPDFGLAANAYRLHQEDLADGVINFLKTGILASDAVSTVSHTYAREIQTAEFGSGLEDVLQTRRERLVGIVNGVDYTAWDPATDTRIPYPYDATDMSGKERNKRYLLESLGLPYREGVPLVGIISRLVAQKGFDLLFDVMAPALLRKGFQFIVLGNGEPRYETYFAGLQNRFPSQVCFYRGYNNRLAGLIEAGSDMFLMPSQYEPCGLNQMYSLKYGTVPIVRNTGGLADTVSLFDPATGEGTGVVFDHYTAEALKWGLETALGLYRQPSLWSKLVANGMAQDFSWRRQVEQYVDLYRRLIDL